MLDTNWNADGSCEQDFSTTELTCEIYPNLGLSVFDTLNYFGNITLRLAILKQQFEASYRKFEL